MSRLTYKCLKNNFFKSGKFALAPIAQEEMESIRLWRNSQMELLRQNKEISSEEQMDYYRDKVEPLFHQETPVQLFFAFYSSELLIGYGALVNISWHDKRAEVSFLLNPQFTEDKEGYREKFIAYLSLLHRIAFEELKLHRLYTETYHFRLGHIAILEEFGFILEGVLRDHIYKQQGVFSNSLMHGLLATDSIYEQ